MICVYKSNCEDFDNNGIGILTDFKTNPIIKESLNGSFEASFDYLRNGRDSDLLVVENIVKLPYDNTEQLFRIKRVKPNLNKINVYLRHIFYDLNDNYLSDVRPTNKSGVAAGQYLLERAMYPTKFKFFGDVSNINTAFYIDKNIVEAILGAENSLVNRWGGEIERDNFNINYYKKRGNDKGVWIKEGKNIKEIEFTVDFDSVVTRIVPKGFNGLSLPEEYIDSPLINTYRNPIVRTITFSDIEVNEDTTEEEALNQLREAANAEFENGIDKPKVSISVNWLELSKMDIYKERYSSFEKVRLGDTVTVKAIGYEYKIRVISVEYDCLLDKFISFEIGDPLNDFATSQQNAIKKEVQKVNSSLLNDAKLYATNLINNGFGGKVKVYPDRVLIMDTDDISTAKNVWQWNMNGFGHSSTGIDGPYETAMTMDGRIVADFITTGELDANLIKGWESLLLQVSSLEQNSKVSKNASGNLIEITDAGKHDLESIEIEGKSYQKTINGYQLFDASKIATNTQSGATLTNNENGSFTISGTGNLTSSFSHFKDYSHEDTIKLLKPGTINFEVGVLSLPYALVAFRRNGQWIREMNNKAHLSQSFEITQEMLDDSSFYMRIGFYGANGATITPKTIRPMLYQEGNETFEPFTGGKPSPNPEFPQKIEVVKGVTNLVDYSVTTSDGKVIATDGSLATNALGKITDYFAVKPNTTYIFTYKSNDYSFNQRVSEYTKEKTFIKRNVTNTGKLIFTTSSTTYYINVSGLKTDYDVMVIEGSIAHNYVPHGTWLLQKTHGKNFFDKDSAKKINLYPSSTTFIAGNSYHSTYIEVEPNETYTAKKFVANNQDIVMATSKDVPVSGGDVSQIKYSSKNEALTITSNEDDKYLTVYYNYGSTNEQEILDNLMIVKGDTITNYESYKENTALIDMNKPNLFDKNNMSILEAYFTSAEPQIMANSVNRTIYIHCKPNTIYTITKYLSSIFLIGYTNTVPNIDTQVSGIVVGSIGTYNDSYTQKSIVTGNDAKYLCIRFYHTINDKNVPLDTILDSIKIYEGYEPYYELSEVADTKDIFKDGVLTKRIGKYILTGDENWSLSSYSNNKILSVYYNFFPNCDYTKPYISNKFKFIYNVNNTTTDEYISNALLNTLRIGINKNRLSSNDLNGFKNFLKEQYNNGNPVIVYCVLAEPQTYELSYEPLKLFEGYNYITLNDDLLPTMNIEYLTNSSLTNTFASRSELLMTEKLIRSSLNAKIKNTEEGFNNSITELNNDITQELNERDNSIILGVNNTLKNYSTTKQVEAKLELKVSTTNYNQVISMINMASDNITLKGGSKIHLKTPGQLIIDAGNFKLDAEGTAELNNGIFSGKVTAKEGEIGGWTLSSIKMYAGDENTGVAVVQMPTENTAWVFAAGGKSHSSYSDCPFRVSKTGELYSTKGNIAGWEISEHRLYKKGTDYRLYIEDGSEAAKGDFITVLDKDGNATLHITAKGKLTCTDAEIKGKIDATSGTIGGCTISNGTLNIAAANITSGTFASARIPNLNASKITAGTLTGVKVIAKTGEVGSWTIEEDYLSGKGSDGYTVQISPNRIYVTNGSSMSNSTTWFKIASSGSDRRIKNNINYLSEENFESFFDSLKPVCFNYNEDFSLSESKQKHFGFIAQDILEAAENSNIKDLAMVYEDESYYKDEKYYKLDKQELIALNTWQIQKLKKLFEKMTDKINEMEGLLCH